MNRIITGHLNYRMLTVSFMSGFTDKVNKANKIAKEYTAQSTAKAARYLDFQSIRFIYDSAKRLNDKSVISEGWFNYLDSQIISERDRYSLQIINAEYEKNWEELAKWSGKAVTEYPTYYNYYRPRGYACLLYTSDAADE